jgi:hypothetical protein
VRLVTKKDVTVGGKNRRLQATPHVRKHASLLTLRMIVIFLFCTWRRQVRNGESIKMKAAFGQGCRYSHGKKHLAVQRNLRSSISAAAPSFEFDFHTDHKP